MCTAVSLLSGDFYFGRNLDYEFSYGDEVKIGRASCRERV